VPRSLEALHDFYAFRDFPHFAAVYGQVSALITGQEDIEWLIRGVARDMAACNVRYAEIQVSPWYFTHVNGIGRAAVTEAMNAGRKAALAEHGVRIGWIIEFPGDRAGEAAYPTLDHVLSQSPEGVVGFGVGGAEQGRAPHTSVIRDVFRGAVAAGLHSIPHAGEMTGPETVWEALRFLSAERIGHGINSLRDPSLVACLRERQVPIDVSLTSNVCTRQVASLREHPLPAMLEAGLLVTLNSDDPPMFGTTLNNEYLAAATATGLSRPQLAELAANAVRASFLSAEAKKPLLAEIAAVASA
jgi:adenosine deaminase